MPIYALNQVSEERCEWLVPGMLEAKVLALVKSLHQRPRSRLVPLPEYVDEFVADGRFGEGELLDVLPHTRRRGAPAARVQRNDFKLEHALAASLHELPRRRRARPAARRMGATSPS